MSVGRTARTAALIGAPLLLIGVLAWPMLFTNGDFNEDWAHHLWFMWNQSLALRDNYHPTLFLNATYSVFYPEYAFYGGTLYVLGGALSLLLGNAPIETYVLIYLLGFAAAYGGWYWMARAAGLGAWWAHVPGVVFITSAYYLTLIYARGDLPEFIGVSMMPLLIASGLSVLRADRLRAWPALALAASSIVFCGSHSLTLIWGSTLIALVGLAAACCVPDARRWLTRRGLLRVASVVIPAFLVSAWFLLPTLVYQSHTQVGVEYSYWRFTLRATMNLVSANNLFALSRVTATPGNEFVLSLPLLAMAWSLIGILICWFGGLRGAWVRLLLICAAAATLMIVVMTHAGLILALPKPYAILQFAYRLESYVILAVSGAVLVCLVAIRSGTPRIRSWRWMLAPILIVALAGAVQQTGAYPHGQSRQAVIRSPFKSEFTERILTDYTDGSLPHFVDRGKPVEVIFPAAAIHDNHISKVVHLRPGELVYTNIGGGPELVHVGGAKIVGVDPADNDVLEIGPSARASAASANHRPTEVITLSTASGPPLVLGRVLSLVGVISLIALFVALLIRRRAAHPREGAAGNPG
ncbi:MAG TPA: hypothetical protein VGL37_04325 [Solirubrobacteraceae bacterium]|jgi:hypothetical protein